MALKVATIPPLFEEPNYQRKITEFDLSARLSANCFLFTADERFLDTAVAEVRAQLPGCRWRLLGSGAGWVECDEEFQVASEKLRARSIFIRHLQPVHGQWPLPEDHSLEPVVEQVLASLTPAIDRQRPVSVQARVVCIQSADSLGINEGHLGRTFAQALRERLNQQVDRGAEGQILSLLLTNQLGGGLSMLAGLSSAIDNRSAWSGGARRYAQRKDMVSRSEFKLMEAFEVFSFAPKAEGLAIDLGAAPGGWSHVLIQRGLKVLAVDPAALDRRVIATGKVEHFRVSAQEFLERSPKADLIVNDMRMDARDSARLMGRYAATIRDEGAALITLKLPETRYDNALATALDLLAQHYEIVGVRHLFHDRSEVTALLRPRPSR